MTRCPGVHGVEQGVGAAAQALEAWPEGVELAAREVLEADLLDDQYNGYTESGNTIRMGVERDRWQRPVAYWFYSNHPGDTGFIAGPTQRDTQRKRIAADEILHVFRKVRVG